MVDGSAWWRAPRVPARDWVPSYRREQLGRDLIAGAVVTALVIPQALGYATIARVPVQVGLYAVPLALVAYALLGSSRQVIVGPVSTVSVVSGSIVAANAGGDPERAIALTVALAVLSGVILLAAGALRTGWIAEFLSKPIVSGFVFGLSVVIIIGELPSLLGLERVDGAVYQRALATLAALPELDATTALIGLGGLAVLFVGNAITRQVPWALLVVVAALVASATWSLADRGVAVVGEVPRGLPVPALPPIAWSDVASLVVPAMGLALVGLAETLSAARLFAAQGGYRIDPDQEFVATGAANVASGLFGGLGVAGSLSKTAAVARAGGTSQVTSVVAAALSLGVLVLFAPSLSDLPRAVLAAVVIHAVWGLMDVGALRRYAAIRRNDLVAALGALLGVLAFGTLAGLLIAVGLSVFGLVYRASRVEVEEMGRIDGEKAAWGSIERHPERRRVDGLVILRLTAPLFWVNAATVEDRIIAIVDRRPDTRALVLDLEATDQLDTTSTDMLRGLLGRLRRRGVDLYLVRVMFQARVVLKRSGLRDEIGDLHLWRTIAEGVKRAKRDHQLRGHARSDTEVEGADADERIVVDLDRGHDDALAAGAAEIGDADQAPDRAGTARAEATGDSDAAQRSAPDER
ncbi:MAG: SulP family inorganic anion transporter [Nitriliruptoraceae bacterium]